METITKERDLIATRTFNSACEYFAGASVLQHNPHFNLFNEPVLLLLPGFTLSAFSCELFLKAILYKTTNISFDSIKFKYKHHLDKLYSAIPDEIKIQIINNFSKYEYDENQLVAALKQNDGIFQDVRYDNEKTGVYSISNFMETLSCVLLDVCRTLFK